MTQTGKLIVLFVIVTASLAAFPMSVTAYAQGAAKYIKVKNLAPGRILLMRSGPGRSFEPIAFLPHNARHIRSFGCKNLATGRWCDLIYRGVRGWASQRYLTTDRRRRT